MRTLTPHRLSGVAVIVAACACAPALAASEGSQNPLAFELIPYFATLIVFGVVFYILSKYVWPKILGGLRDREERIRSEIRAAELARQQAADSLKDYEKSLAEARAETSAMLERTKADQARLAAELRAKADTELAAMRERARKDIDVAKREAVRELYAHASAIAAELAAKVLEREINADDHKRLIEDSLGELEAANR
ncbi:MAG: ATP synthase F0 subunit B [Phycisphaerales bacterium]|nr:MAG: ATP synthase F0 subunit B [Phycisphaerales bacterium]